MASDQTEPIANLPQTVRRYLSQKVAEFRAALDDDDTASLEDYVNPARDKLRPHLLRALLPVDFEYRRESGETVASGDYIERFPELRNVIETVLPADAAAMTIAERSSSNDESEPSTQTETLVGESTPKTIKPRGPAAKEIGPYRIVRELGRGGMGVVYLATEKNLQRQVALKLLRSDGFDSPEERTRFRNEANTLAKIQHPNIVHIFRIGKHENSLYIALEYVDGPNLAVFLGGNPQPPKEAAAFIQVLADAIHAMHEQGIIHRDLKPANVLLQISDRRIQNEKSKNTAISNLQSAIPKITDFGLAKGTDDDHALTRTGDLLGTPSYMAPEQASGLQSDIGPAADVYALGVILYEALTGRPPFKADTLLTTLEQVRHQEPVPPSRLQGKIPRDLETICLKCLQKEPRKRYASAKDLADDLGRFQNGEPIRARPVGAVERTWRWCRRNPLASALTAAVVLALLGGTAAASYFAVEASHRAREAERSSLKAKQALAQTEKANAAEKKTRDRVEWTLYAHQICWAQRELMNDKKVKAGMILDTCIKEMRHWEYQFLRGWSSGSGRTLYEGKQPVVDAAFSSDGRHIAYALADGSTRIVDLDTATSPLELTKHEQPVIALAFVDGDKRLATIDAAGNIRVWNTADGKLAYKLTAEVGKVTSVAFDPKTDRLAAAGDDGVIQIWDLQAKKMTGSWKAHNGTIGALAFHPTADRLASGGEDRLIQISSTNDKKHIRTLEGHIGPIYALAYSKDGGRLASGGTANAKQTEGQIVLWNPDDGQQLLSVENPLGAIRSISFSVDNDRLVTGTSDGMVKFWEAQHGQELLCLSEHAKNVARVAFSADGRYVLSASHDNTLKIWDSQPPRDKSKEK